MKKFMYLAAFVCALALSACSEPTPQGDKTQLWPAGEKGSLKWGYMDKSGKLQIKADFDGAYGFSCGWALVVEEKDPKFIDKGGKTGKAMDASEMASYYFYYNLLPFVDGKLCGLYDNKFNIAIPADYADLNIGDNGLIAFREDGEDEMGYLNKSGKVVIEPEWHYAGGFYGGIAVVMTAKKSSDGEYTYKYGVIDKSGKYLIEPQKNGLFNMGEGRVGFQKSSGKVGMMDKNGNELGGSYDGGDEFSCGLARVIKSLGGASKYGFVDKDGNEVISCKYAQAYHFYDDVAFVKKDADSKWEAIDKQGNSLFKLKEDEYVANAFHNGLALVYSYDEEYNITYRYIDKTGETVYRWKLSMDNSAFSPQKDLPRQISEKEILFH